MTDDEIEAEIQAKGLTAPRVTLADIEAAIEAEHYFTAEDGSDNTSMESFCRGGPHPSMPCLTFCVLVLKNGFTVTGESKPVVLANFDAELGRKIARQNAVDKCWPLFGFLLACVRSGWTPIQE